MSTTRPNSAVEPKVEKRIVVDQIWPAVYVNYCLLTSGQRQYVAYYNSDRRMVVATRMLHEEKFTHFVLTSKSDQPPERGKSSTVQGWDSHNYITMAVDDAGDLHLAGNMHVNALTYFRTHKPGDLSTIQQIDSMVGARENHCTYPHFMNGPNGALLFHYRDGYSGNGEEIYNAYDLQSKTWRRFLDKPLISGMGDSNAYQVGPIKGPDGWYHLLWMWRDTPDVVTNHDLSYARSRNLVDWETAGGKPLSLPITPKDKATIIDPVPVNGGLHNSVHRLGFDRQNRAVVTYFKHDADGNTQAYAARFVKDRWDIQQISKWEGQHIFRGGGSGPSTFGTSLSLGTAQPYGSNSLSLAYRHWKAGAGLLVFDEETLAPVEVVKQSDLSPFPAELTKVTSDFPGMRVNWREDDGRSPDSNVRYVLRWESLGSNRDRPRTGDLPGKSDLVLYGLTVAP